ncbi:hypothetical protein BJY52DRAFT_1232098 [Lactarius psammicola]|nr:hypothetical protein BJY52DRAFT_1232098 [Lactarius psammicola]
MDFHLEDDDSHVKPDGKSFFVTQDEVDNGERILKYGSDKEVSALPYNVLRRLCSDTKTIRYSRKRKEQLVERLLYHCTTHGWPLASTIQNVANHTLASPSSEMNASTSTSKPTGRRVKLATDVELQDGRAKYTSAKSLSKIRPLRKGVIVTLLLELDIPPSPSNLDDLLAMNKPDLERMLWDMHKSGARPRIGASTVLPGGASSRADMATSVASYLASSPETQSGATKRDLASRRFVEPLFSTAWNVGHGSHINEEYLEGSDQGSDVLREEFFGDKTEPIYSSGTTTEISDTTDDCSAEEISLDGDLKDVRHKRARPKSSQERTRGPRATDSGRGLGQYV